MLPLLCVGNVVEPIRRNAVAAVWRATVLVNVNVQLGPSIVLNAASCGHPANMKSKQRPTEKEEVNKVAERVPDKEEG